MLNFFKSFLNKLHRNAINLILSLTLLTFLPGCLGGIFLVGAAAGGAIVYDRRTLDAMHDDYVLQREITANLLRNKLLNSSSRIVVATFNRIVLLTGQAYDQPMRTLAQDITEKTPGIRRIYNEIIISPPITALVTSSDSWITTKVKAKMLATKGLHSSQIKVITENSTVYLLGLVTRAQAKLAVDVARSIGGVQRVVKIFEYE